MRAPLERTWRTLSDAAVFASCLPGGNLHPSDDAYTGHIRFGSNDEHVECEATVRPVDQDHDEHVATILIHGRQLGGPGIGSATVQSRCRRSDSSTHVVLTAEVLASGHEHPDVFAQNAREQFERIGDRLKEYAANAGPELAAPQPAGMPAGTDALLPVPVQAQNRLPLVVALGGAVAAVVVARRLLGRRRSGLW